MNFVYVKKRVKNTYNICITLDEGAVSYVSNKNWPQLFKDGNFVVFDEPDQRSTPTINVKEL